MNHIHRVTLQLYENNVRDDKGTVVMVIVKTAPDEVLVCLVVNVTRGLMVNVMVCTVMNFDQACLQAPVAHYVTLET